MRRQGQGLRRLAVGGVPHRRGSGRSEVVGGHQVVERAVGVAGQHIAQEVVVEDDAQFAKCQAARTPAKHHPFAGW